jgi:hypothetical protein
MLRNAEYVVNPKKSAHKQLIILCKIFCSLGRRDSIKESNFICPSQLVTNPSERKTIEIKKYLSISSAPNSGFPIKRNATCAKTSIIIANKRKIPISLYIRSNITSSNKKHLPKNMGWSGTDTSAMAAPPRWYLASRAILSICYGGETALV